MGDHVWPERLTLRDTKIHADEGQRIYTTATGYGYEKCQYVRGDIADDMLAALAALHERYVMAIGNEGPEAMAARLAIAKAEGQS